jgi:hypothetical protein
MIGPDGLSRRPISAAIDGLCGYLVDKPDEDIPELTEQETAEHEPCRGCAG